MIIMGEALNSGNYVPLPRACEQWQLILSELKVCHRNSFI